MEKSEEAGRGHSKEEHGCQNEKDRNEWN